NLSTMHALPPQNQISQGSWFDDSKPEASVEEGLAKTLGMKLGDRISFDVAGQVLEAQITSLRKLEWGSMQVNFFVILNPALMADMPQSWITAVRVGDDNVRLASDLVSDFPNLTVVDVGSVIRQ